MKHILVKSVLNKKKQRDAWFLDEYTLNPFEGCSFNCQYCYVRGSKYGENMEDTLAIKTNALDVLDRQLSLRARKQQYGIIALASATDPYLRAEAEQQMTRSMLQLILKHKFPVLLITKSPGVLRDLDLLQQIDRDAVLPPDLAQTLGRGAILSFSLSTLETDIAAT
ncbi:MAG: radical SAM protein, partial [Bacteroidia bacterium]|nr:radical SAM protein [Bacteroidia bacterium]